MRKIYISKYANKALIEYLSKQGYDIVLVERMADIDEPISCHPDIYMCDLGMPSQSDEGGDSSNSDSSNQKSNKKINLYHGEPGKLTHDYPGHAIYNACSTGKYFIHNLKITEPNLLEAAKSAGLITVHVPQGYAKCSIVAVDENSIITADKGIEKACTAAGMDVLLIEKGQVLLDGYPYGFIGGASGKAENVILFNGDVRRHSDFKAIKSFIEERGLEIKYFEDYPLTDIGSIIEEYCIEDCCDESCDDAVDSHDKKEEV